MSGFTSGASDSTLIVTAMQDQTKVLAETQQTLSKVFPQATGTAATATGGAATLPANPVGFLQVFVPSLGATVKIPYYNT